MGGATATGACFFLMRGNFFTSSFLTADQNTRRSEHSREVSQKVQQLCWLPTYRQEIWLYLPLPNDPKNALAAAHSDTNSSATGCCAGDCCRGRRCCNSLLLLLDGELLDGDLLGQNDRGFLLFDCMHARQSSLPVRVTTALPIEGVSAEPSLLLITHYRRHPACSIDTRQKPIQTLVVCIRTPNG